ncbi:MAG: DUF5615 family PIN-like protein [Anaerolineales bacterium]|nr:DUF5615 family PIN-like protein [Anaerolineales bacterium]
MTALLFDQNLPPQLVYRLRDVFPGSQHVSEVGLGAAFDREVWDYAQAHDLVLVSKDADFSEIGLLLGFPPKVVWIRRGNCSTADVEALLRQHREAIDMFAVDTDNSVLAVF